MASIEDTQAVGESEAAQAPRQPDAPVVIPRPTPQPNDPCPCGSQRSYASCRLAEPALLHPQHAVTKPKRPSTNAANPKCYARSFNDCDSITGEHVISDCVLESLANGGPLRTSGKMFSRSGELRQTGPNSLVSNVLCGRHNSCLNTLDTQGLRFQQALQRIMVAAHPHLPHEGRPYHALVNGHDVERWLLKSLCAAVASGQAGFNDGREDIKIRDAKIDDQVLAELFDGQLIHRPRGLYVRSSPVEGVGEVAEPKDDVGLKVLIDYDTRAVLGVELRLHSMDFILWTDNGGRAPRQDLEPLLFRPQGIYARRGDHVAFLELSWTGPSEGRYVEVLEARHTGGKLAEEHWPSLRWGHPTID